MNCLLPLAKKMHPAVRRHARLPVLSLLTKAAKMLHVSRDTINRRRDTTTRPQPCTDAKSCRLTHRGVLLAVHPANRPAIVSRGYSSSFPHPLAAPATLLPPPPSSSLRRRLFPREMSAHVGGHSYYHFVHLESSSFECGADDVFTRCKSSQSTNSTAGVLSPLRCV